MKRKWIRYIIGALVAFISVWILLLAAALVYVKINKENIIASVQSDITKKISGKISFDDLTIDPIHNFPGISIGVRNLHVQDSDFNNHKKELLFAQHLYLGFGILDVLTGKKIPEYIRLTDGKIIFFADSLGNKNWKILRPQSKSQEKISIKKIALKNMNVFFEDDGKYKFYNVWFEKLKCNLYEENEQITFKTDCRSIIKNSSFNTRKGSYLTNKKLVGEWKILYDRSDKKLSLTNQLARLDRQSYRLSANFFLGADPHFTLHLKTSNLTLNEAASIFPPKAAKRIASYHLSRPLQKVEALLSGEMKYLHYPLASISFSVSDASLDISPTRFEHCSFDGLFKNEIDSSKPRDDKNSFMRFTEVKGQWEKNSFDSKDITVYNLIHPYIRCNVHTIFDLSQLDKAIASGRLDLNSGKGEATLTYEGPLETKSDTIYNLNGTVRINDGDITYNPRNLNFRKTDIQLEFKNGDMLVRKMNTTANSNNISIHGRVNNFLNFFNTDPSKAVFDWNIYSPRIDISELRSSLHRKSSAKKKTGYSFFERLNNKIDRLFDACNAYLTIQAEKVIYKKFSATNVRGNLTLTNDIIKLDNFSLLHAGGSINFSALSKDNGNKSDLVLRSKMQNVNVKELFRSFNNFGLGSLKSENISGSFSADISLSSMLDADNNLYKPANKGYVDFSLRNGKLENFVPLMEIDNNFLQKRNLSSISFAELKDRLDLNGNEIRVNRMEIRSTAASMYVEGVYSFANNTDLSIQIPLHGQKKHQDKIPENKGLNSKTGISIFLRAKDDKDGKLKINYDLFGRFRNKN